MKKHLSSLVFGCLGLCVGFTLCYLYLVLPEWTARATTPQAPYLALLRNDGHSHLEWQPYLIQPMLPPKVIGKYEYRGR